MLQVILIAMRLESSACLAVLLSYLYLFVNFVCRLLCYTILVIFLSVYYEKKARATREESEGIKKDEKDQLNFVRCLRRDLDARL